MRILKAKSKKSKEWHEVDSLTGVGYYSPRYDTYFKVELNLEEFEYLVSMPKRKYEE